MPKPDGEIEKDYPVSKGDIYLSVTVGEGQYGTTSVDLDNKELVGSVAGHIGRLRVGSGPDVGGSLLLVENLVTDVSSGTNRMSVTYVLEGGKGGKKEFVVRGKADNEGDALYFRAKFTLVPQEKS